VFLLSRGPLSSRPVFVGVGLVFALGLLWLVLARQGNTSEIRAGMDLQRILGGADIAGYARASAPRAFEFPRDHGPHPEFRTEWWYFTGNLQTGNGRRFGYQLTFFRIALAPDTTLAVDSSSDTTPALAGASDTTPAFAGASDASLAFAASADARLALAEASDSHLAADTLLASVTRRRTSHWAARHAYMAHFAVTDVNGQSFAAFERFGRGALDLAGARAVPFAVWLEDWSVRASGNASFPVMISAADSGIAIRLELDADRAPVAQGDRGLSRKGAEPGNASHYYSMTRMPTRGRIQLRGRSYDVAGDSWMDREWSTSGLGAGRVGWDWFALQLSDGRELMYYQIRDTLGRADPFSAGSVSARDGVHPLAQKDVLLDVVRSWQSPRGNVRYPAEWRIRVPSQALDLRVRPVLADQELNLWVRYWEGAVDVTGTSRGRTVNGRGYVELTGYAGQFRSPGSARR
jgi:predicted secreted hydrolase